MFVRQKPTVSTCIEWDVWDSRAFYLPEKKLMPSTDEWALKETSSLSSKIGSHTHL